MAMKKIRDDSNINHEKKTSLRRRKTIKRESSRREMMTSLDEQTYQLVFERTEHRCEECGARLPDRFRDDDGKVICRFQYSHILTKSSHPELRHNPKNFNRLCMSCHGKWEFGDRDKMRIYESNKIIIQQLLRREK
jgi:5-methylcytosine-specific restriction endonuclease McrA